MWGLLPIYWKLLDSIHPFEILANRIIFSAIFVAILIICSGQFKSFIADCKFIFSNSRRILILIAASIFIAINWGTFIWAVNTGHILFSSMGYYINPLASVLLGIIFLREKLNSYQIAAVIFSAAGAVSMLIQLGEFPWISFVLAFSFAFYGLMKKMLLVSAFTTIMLESLLLSPIMIFYEYYLSISNNCVYQNINLSNFLLLAASGIATAIPLIFFSAGAKKLQLKIVGFLQYISPTLSLFIGIFIYKESFTAAHFIAFGLIWIGIIIFSISQIKENNNAQ
jgi:chloramphenicol-sensitive protein RarD